MPTNAYVLMTAMPATRGHLSLIKYAHNLVNFMPWVGNAPEVHVIVNTQPGEPFPRNRVDTIRRAVQDLSGVHVHHIHQHLPQEPAGHEGFWDMWRGFLKQRGLVEGKDVIVASELYGKPLAEACGVQFYPYDIDRSLLWSKATNVRREPLENFSMMLPGAQELMRKTVTIFGAESTGKTTLSRALAAEVNGHWLFEYARPYLETVGTEITEESMRAIWHGQMALQMQGRGMEDKPFIIQDTDLFSTVGYWNFWDLETMPAELVTHAHVMCSDLYLITQSNIPFEQDPIRYGGDKREQDDAYWVDICETFGLPYVVLQGETVKERLREATLLCEDLFLSTPDVLALQKYERKGQ